MELIENAMRNFKFNFKQPEVLSSKVDKWIRGLNTTVSNTQIKPEELSEAVDIQLVEDGKVQCPRDGQTYFGVTSGSRVRGLFPYYKSDGTKKLYRTEGTHLQLYSSSAWTNVTGFTYTDNLDTNGVMAYDRLYLVNGTDPLTYCDGSTITSFTAISSPGAPTVTRTGTTGTYTFSYKVTAITAVGETAASAAGTQVANVATLDTTTYMTISWSAVTNATGYNVYGRKDGNWTFIAFLEGNASVSYVDKGAVTPSTVFTAPENNTTAGPTGKYIEVYKDSLFILGDPANPSRLYYSAGGDLINDFTVSNGGGFIDISKNDGQEGSGLKNFKNSLLVFKEDSTYQFSFTTEGLPQVTQVSPSIGCIAPRSIVAVENDIFFASRRGIFSIGNEAGFAFDVLRTNELSARVRSVFKTIDPAYIDKISTIYTSDANKNLVIFSYTPTGSVANMKAIVYDRERLAWYKWTNIPANCWATYRGTDGITHYLYGDDTSGYVKEILTGSDDFGSAIGGEFSIRAEDFKTLNRYKKLKDIDVVLRKPSGTITLSVIVDGVTTAYTANIGTISPSINFGHYLFNRFLFKDSYGTGISSADEIVLRTLKNINIEGRSYLLTFSNSSTGSFTLLLTDMRARPRSVRYRKSGEVVSA